MQYLIHTTFFKACVVSLPWFLKRFCLQKLYNFYISPTSFIGLSWVFPKYLSMDSGSRIDSFTVVVNIDHLELHEYASIGRFNWITGYPKLNSSNHFLHQPDRCSRLTLGAHAAITKNHHIDATSIISIGPYTTIAGYGSQMLSHSIDLKFSRQHSEPISIGSHCFVGSNCVILGGSTLPNYSVLGALSLLNKRHTQTWSLYAGSPARHRKNFDKTYLYFSRSCGFVF